jgi:predicted dehydrogenase
VAERTRYAVVGTGSRAGMYIGAITGTHADVAQLVATVDVNLGRMEYYDEVVAESEAGRAGRASAPSHWSPDDLERAIADEHVDRVIVTSPDFTHAEMVTRALRAGADVVVEKPLTIDEAGSAAIAKAVRDTGRSLVMTFNYRYSPRNSAFRRVIQSGAIGRPLSVHFEWVLDTAHGADYFRRWHRDKQNTGGLLIHKASHHFDLVNWWIDDVPARVFASGGLRFYGAENARRDGRDAGYERGTADGVTDPFALDLRDDPTLRALYYDAERYDGYRRDRNVFDPGITIEDNLSLVVDYAGGASMSYSLNAHSPWEGYTVAVNGTRGRAELTVVERGEVVLGGDEHSGDGHSGDGHRGDGHRGDGHGHDGHSGGHGHNGHSVIDPSAVADTSQAETLRPRGERILLQQHWQSPREVPITQAQIGQARIGQGDGGHGGGDAMLLRDVFVGPTEDSLARAADYVDGVKAIAVGISGNRSLATGLPVRVDQLELGVDLVALGAESRARKGLGTHGVNQGAARAGADAGRTGADAARAGAETGR